jgi:hypothetical protein
MMPHINFDQPFPFFLSVSLPECPGYRFIVLKFNDELPFRNGSLGLAY